MLALLQRGSTRARYQGSVAARLRRRCGAGSLARSTTPREAVSSRRMERQALRGRPPGPPLLARFVSRLAVAAGCRAVVSELGVARADHTIAAAARRSCQAAEAAASHRGASRAPRRLAARRRVRALGGACAAALALRIARDAAAAGGSRAPWPARAPTGRRSRRRAAAQSAAGVQVGRAPISSGRSARLPQASAPAGKGWPHPVRRRIGASLRPRAARAAAEGV
mmetsp:Transcript_1342/g.3076  ORF Transcript_1342/g.3076 Transcript_1342/m.3076 type:complete len:225 (+) Transcript_1342:246-920(+)